MDGPSPLPTPTPGCEIACLIPSSISSAVALFWSIRLPDPPSVKPGVEQYLRRVWRRAGKEGEGASRNDPFVLARSIPWFPLLKGGTQFSQHSFLNCPNPSDSLWSTGCLWSSSVDLDSVRTPLHHCRHHFSSLSKGKSCFSIPSHLKNQLLSHDIPSLI